MRIWRASTLAAAGVVLAGCQVIADAPAGPLSVGTARVSLGREWANINGITPQRPTNVTLLTIDGPQLDKLYISDGLKPGEGIVTGADKDKPAPILKAGLSNAERVEFIASSVSAMGLLKVEARKPRPATYAGHPGVRMDISASTQNGLDISGTALIAEVGDKTYVILYLAPSEHYFDANLAEVEQVMASAAIGS